jgi:hypothetical protein
VSRRDVCCAREEMARRVDISMAAEEETPILAFTSLLIKNLNPTLSTEEEEEEEEEEEDR